MTIKCAGAGAHYKLISYIWRLETMPTTNCYTMISHFQLFTIKNYIIARVALTSFFVYFVVVTAISRN